MPPVGPYKWGFWQHIQCGCCQYTVCWLQWKVLRYLPCRLNFKLKRKSMTRQRLHAQQAVTPACISSWYHHDVINIIMMSSISSWCHRYHHDVIDIARISSYLRAEEMRAYAHTVLYCKMSRFGQLLKWSNIIYFAFVFSVEASNRKERSWPVSGSSSVDLPQSSPFGPRLKISENRR